MMKCFCADLDLVHCQYVSVLNVGLLLAGLNADSFLLCHEDLLFTIELELIVDGARVKHLDRVLIKGAPLHLFEVPGD